jgi:chlorite dismutase
MTQEKLTDLVGWAVMHQFFRIDRSRWRALDHPTRSEAIAEFADQLNQYAGEEGLQFIPLAGVAKSDFGFMAVHPDLSRIQRLGQEIASTAFGACLAPVYAFLSMSEVSEYMSTATDWTRHLVEDQKLDPASSDFAKSLAGFEKRMAAYAEARVHPQLPTDMPIVCFYPMSKAREAGRNWYILPFEERKKLMGGHADTGRRFAGRILQLITSSTGIDDWEWGVTLFARDLKSVRDVVYEMRFDAGSAVYGQFGEFYMALRFQSDELAETLHL